jgi:hypothetical protein
MAIPVALRVDFKASQLLHCFPQPARVSNPGSRRACGAVPITITERDGVCSIMTGKTTTGTVAARWWIRSWGFWAAPVKDQRPYLGGLSSLDNQPLDFSIGSVGTRSIKTR